MSLSWWSWNNQENRLLSIEEILHCKAQNYRGLELKQPVEFDGNSNTDVFRWFKVLFKVLPCIQKNFSYSKKNAMVNKMV